MLLGACAALPAAALAQNQPLTLKPGIYVRQASPCNGAPNAEILAWDGIGFSGAHSSKCTSTMRRKSGNLYDIRTSCTALGDGTPNPSGNPYFETITLTWQSGTRFTLGKPSQSQGTYRWCSATIKDQRYTREAVASRMPSALPHHAKLSPTP